MPKGRGYKRKRKPRKGTGGALARSGGSVTKAFKDLGKLKKRYKV